MSAADEEVEEEERKQGYVVMDRSGEEGRKQEDEEERAERIMPLPPSPAKWRRMITYPEVSSIAMEIPEGARVPEIRAQNIPVREERGGEGRREEASGGRQRHDEMSPA
ncbi:hypothetical protein EYF80_045212 [Liparis tanakae]|uniref:Uncharacterized protein n=1 Tax=Liparis tanakae TaxID=230148 RepID=A0A4Z2FUL4_9TELE|nr:hypothetical protein EYF80_045212 [Liparis tanakae]